MSTVFTDIFTGFYNRISTNWVSGGQPKLPILIGNQSGVGMNITSAGFIRLDDGKVSSLTAMSNGVATAARYEGIFEVHIAVPQNAGMGKALQYADEIATVVQNASFGNGITTYLPELYERGTISFEKSTYFRILLGIKFLYQTTIPIQGV